MDHIMARVRTRSRPKSLSGPGSKAESKLVHNRKSQHQGKSKTIKNNPAIERQLEIISRILLFLALYFQKIALSNVFILNIDNNRHRCIVTHHWNLARPQIKANTAWNKSYIARCASVLARAYLAGSWPGKLAIDLFAHHQRYALCCMLSIADCNLFLSSQMTKAWPIADRTIGDLSGNL